MNKKDLQSIFNHQPKHIDAVFVYQNGIPVAYMFAPYIPDNPETFFNYNSKIEKIYEYLKNISTDKLYHYGVSVNNKDIYLFVYKVDDDTYIFVFSDSQDIELGEIVYRQIIKPLKDYLSRS
ncbi:hypothetical protein [Persephonella sp.]|uniref:hypothetical protein n=1 Tax=Persephonella sp. TaxID=2060922 RepID=UPI0025D00CAD|nr:hypothetical protein [Persephonella sp.]